MNRDNQIKDLIKKNNILRTKIIELEKVIIELEKVITELKRRLDLNSSNSGKPPSRWFKKTVTRTKFA